MATQSKFFHTSDPHATTVKCAAAKFGTMLQQGQTIITTWWSSRPPSMQGALPQNQDFCNTYIFMMKPSLLELLNLAGQLVSV